MPGWIFFSLQASASGFTDGFSIEQVLSSTEIQNFIYAQIIYILNSNIVFLMK